MKKFIAMCAVALAFAVPSSAEAQPICPSYDWVDGAGPWTGQYDVFWGFFVSCYYAALDGNHHHWYTVGSYPPQLALGVCYAKGEDVV